MSKRPYSVVSTPLDEIDRDILSILTTEGRISYRDLSERVRLSANAVADRVRRLERAGVISGFHAEIDPAAMGRSLMALIDIRLRPEVTMDAAEAALARLPQVLSASHVTGSGDYVLRIACRDPTELDELIRNLNDDVGAIETETRILLRDVLKRRLPFATPD
jgi:Lrp/AsnC family leucine-responsive transcriptional regulator